ncbi:MAG: NAD-dependent epimerase/dehydratase family protein [Candidatus Omnitrophota bacterium]
MKKAVVTGAGGFIGHHLVKRLKAEGYWVRGVDLKRPEFCASPADEFKILDLREEKNCRKALSVPGGFEEVYQLAADMGGMGFIHTAECEIMRNSALINNHMIYSAAALGIKNYFFSSSVCIYRNMKHGEPELTEEGAYPAMPDNEYGWEKLYAERMALAYGRHHKMKIRIARFQNCFGPEGTWRGGREKAPAAMCRKVAEAPADGSIEIWGDGTAVRSYTYVEDMTDGIFRLMHSAIEGPVNIGNPEYISVDDLARTVMEVAKKPLAIRHVPGPVGVESRNFSNEKIYRTGWKACFSTRAGIEKTYPWILEQVRKNSKGR